MLSRWGAWLLSAGTPRCTGRILPWGALYLRGAKTGFAPQCPDGCRCPPAPLPPAGSPPAALSASPGEQRQLQEGAAGRGEPALPFGMRSSAQAGGLRPPTWGWQEPVPGVSHPDMPVLCWGSPATLGSRDPSYWSPLPCEALPGSQQGSGHGTAAKPQEVASRIATCLIVPASDEIQIIHKLLESLILSKEALGTAWNILLLLEVQVLHLPQDGGELQDTMVETALVRKTQNVSQQPCEKAGCTFGRANAGVTTACSGGLRGLRGQGLRVPAPTFLLKFTLMREQEGSLRIRGCSRLNRQPSSTPLIHFA